MIRNYFKTAWRNIKGNKAYSAINILGLAAGMAVALLIGLWVHKEMSFDRVLPGYEQVYSVKRNYNSNGDTLTFPTVSLKLAETLRREVPEIEYVVESDWMGPKGLMVGDTKLYLRGAQSGSDFLKTFRYPLLAGNPATVLNDPYSIVLTESTARALFGNQDPINKVVRFENKDNLKVTGILKDLPSNTSFVIDWIVPFSYMESTNERIKENRVGSFSNNSYQIFVKLKDGISQQQVLGKIRNIEHTEKDNSNAMNSYVFLEPMKNWHLYGKYENGKVVGGFIEYVRMFGIIGILVLLIACINFINLTTARSDKRAKEVGVRKAIGSERKDLIFQFLAESFLLTLLAFLFSLLFVLLALPAFNMLTRSSISIPFGNGLFWALMIACVLITSLIAGSRPAFYLSSFNPVKVLKGTLSGGRVSSWPRKVLVTIQFTCSIALIISTLIIQRQIEHARARPTGYDLNRVLSTDANVELHNNLTAIRNELVNRNIVSSITEATSPANDIYWHSDVDQFAGKLAGETVEMGVVIVDENYFKTLGMSFREGVNFSSIDDTTSLIMNEAAVRRLRLKDPVGQAINFQGTPVTVKGVVKDALVISPFSPADPTFFFCGPQHKGNLIYRLSPAISTEKALAELKAVFTKYNPSLPYLYTFADETYEAKFRMEVLIGKLSGLFAALAILISCLGLFGLAAYVAERRTKEIGIRKVLGATLPQVWLLLSKEFVLLVLISCFVASPLAFYFLNSWLQQYDYRITIGPAVFLFAGVAALVITILTISLQSIRAGLANPVKSLRTE